MTPRLATTLLGALLLAASVFGFRAVRAQDVAQVCTSDAECDDGIFCNGVEYCAPGSAGADAHGCIPDPRGRRPCDPGMTCIEAERRCEVPCDRDRDQDGDGHDSVACGGDDCDDDDGQRYPGNAEVCDVEGHDEDCNLNTYAGPHDADRDGDGFDDARCWNDPRQPMYGHRPRR
jgi:hypothetical protein